MELQPFGHQPHIKGLLPKGPYTRHAYAWQIGPFWQDTLDMLKSKACIKDKLTEKWTFMEAYQRHAAVIENVFLF